ncbi:hypothetical protein MUG87_14375 [Ectobacillus sp. JY-23]|uniref:hypothetical protein n=1 Tax=Ectobacillus sp. JY-23 TaxID=2933872 RepID=UPI001FF19D29|nr:hypothetical protein [Ectobacillus sp. JY-23]UOY91668.1 hypothetical protein MUG87_14375 [Ectobacillus sp. JY-23]
MRKLASFMCMLFLLTACSSEYENHIKAGVKAVKEERYEEAVASFKQAAQEKNDKSVQSYVKASQTMKSSIDALDEGDTKKAILHAQRIVDEKETNKVTEIIKPRAREVIANAKKLDIQMQELSGKLEKARAYADAEQYLEAEKLLQEVSSATALSQEAQELVRESMELWQQVERERRKQESGGS